MGSFFSGGETKVRSGLLPAQKSMLNDISNYLTPFIGQSGPSYSGQRVADLTGLQNSSFGLANDLAGALGGYQQIAKEALSGLGTGAWAQPVVDWTKSLWNDTIMPSIMERQAGMDSAGSGGTTAALAKGGQDLALGMNAQLAPLMQQGLMSSAQLGGDMYNQGMSTLSTLGAMQQQQQQNQLNAAMQSWQEQQPMNSPVWNLASLVLGTNPNTYAKQDSAGLGYSLLAGMGGGLGTGLGGALTGALMPGMSAAGGAGLALLGGL
jgi:hypothetical protein